MALITALEGDGASAGYSGEDATCSMSSTSRKPATLKAETSFDAAFQNGSSMTGIAPSGPASIEHDHDTHLTTTPAASAQRESNIPKRDRTDHLSPQPSVGLHGTSGQTLFERFQFAMAITSGSYFMVVAIGTKDIYLLEFGADASTLGVYWIILNMAAPVLNIVFGRLIQSTALSSSSSKKKTGVCAQLLRKCLPCVFSPPSAPPATGAAGPSKASDGSTSVEREVDERTRTDMNTTFRPATSTSSATTASKYLGKFGLWLIVGCVLGSLGSVAMWMPGLRPSAASGFLEFWFFLTATLCWSGFLILVLVYESSRVCLYPFKEERVTVEGFTKLLFLLMIVIFAALYLAYITSPSVSLQAIVAVMSFCLGSSSLFALRLVRRAKQPVRRVGREAPNSKGAPSSSPETGQGGAQRVGAADREDEEDRQQWAAPSVGDVKPPTASTSTQSHFLWSLRTARYVRHIQHGTTRVFKDYWRAWWLYDANFWICLTRFSTGCWEGTLAACGIFYLTYVCALSRDDRFTWTTYVAVFTSILELVLIPIWVGYFSDVNRRVKQAHTMQNLVGGMRGVDSVMMCLLTLAGVQMDDGQNDAAVICFLAMALIGRLFFSPFTYWRINAQAWCIDEYAHRTGKREEALFYALHAFWYELGRGLVAAILFSAMGWIGGLKTRDCLKLCDHHTADTDAEKWCLDACYDENLAEQPKALETYLEAVYMLICPFFEMMAAFCICRFPIKGDRLLKLYENQGNVFRKVDLDAENDSSSEMASNVGTGSLPLPGRAEQSPPTT